MKVTTLLPPLLVLGLFVSLRASALEPEAERYLRRALNTLQTNVLGTEKIDWQSVRSKALETAKNASKPSETYAALREALLSVDQTAALTEPAANPADQSPPLRIGIAWVVHQGQRVIVRVYPGSAGEQVGLKVGDTILEVNGQPIGPDGLLYPPNSTQISLQLRRVGVSQTIRLEIKLAPYDFYSLRPLVKRLESGIGYLDLPTTSDARTTEGGLSFAAQAQEGIRQADEPAACGWVVDLRRNAGGMVQGFAALGAMLSDGPLVGGIGPNRQRNISYRDGKIYSNDVQAFSLEHPYRIKNPKAPVVALIAKDSIWSSEAFALALRLRAGARLFGEPTAGESFYWDDFSLSDDAIMNFKVADMLDPSGAVIGGEPIKPDQPVTNNPTLYEQPNDPVLNAALEWLKAQPGCR